MCPHRRAPVAAGGRGACGCSHQVPRQASHRIATLDARPCAAWQPLAAWQAADMVCRAPVAFDQSAENKNGRPIWKALVAPKSAGRRTRRRPTNKGACANIAPHAEWVLKTVD